MKIAFIINGNIKKANRVKNDIQSIFNSYSIDIHVSSYAGEIAQLCQNAIQNQCTHFIFVGGDGTLNEGINGIIDFYQIDNQRSGNDFDWEQIKKIKIGVYPAGSANDFVKSIYANSDLENLKNLIDRDQSQLTDIGWVQYINHQKNPSIRFFINITDVGMGGETVRKKSEMPAWTGADFNYFWSITSTVATYQKCKVKVQTADFSWEGNVMNMVVANGKYFGNGLGIAPDALVDDGLFSFIIIGDITLMDYFKHLKKVKQCLKIEHPKVSYHQFQKLQIESSGSHDITIDMDGEFIGTAPLTLECLPQKLNFIR